MIDRSAVPKPGPITALRGRLPKWKTPSADTGSANTESEVHEPAIRGSQTVARNHWLGSSRTSRSPTRSGLQRVGHAVERPDVGDDVDRVAALGLEDESELPAVDQPVALERQIVDGVHDEAVARIVVRRPLAVGDVVAVLHRRRALRVQRVGVGRLRQRVRPVELQPVRQPAVGGDPQAVVVREAEAGDLGDVAERGARQDRARRRHGRKRPHAVDELIDVAGHAQPIALRAEVADHRAGVAAELTLDVDVPGLHASGCEVRDRPNSAPVRRPSPSSGRWPDGSVR